MALSLASYNHARYFFSFFSSLFCEMDFRKALYNNTPPVLEDTGKIGKRNEV